jgi:hypothetical protein
MAKENTLDDIDALEQAIQKAIEETKLKSDEPDFIGNRPVFILCQYLKGTVMSDTTTFADLKTSVQRWYELSKGFLFDEDGEPLSFTEVWAQFIEAWNKVRHPKGNALESAKLRAEKATYQILELDWCDDQSILYLARACYELSRPDGVFFLSGYDAGEMLGRTQKTGRAVLNMFVFEKIIECTKKGHTGIASEYKYIGKPVFEVKATSKFELKKQKMIEALRQADMKDKDRKTK